jgi:acid phosphatase type 7
MPTYFKTMMFLLAAVITLNSQHAYSQTVTRGPYLQMGGQNSITIQWRTNIVSDSRVEIGTSFGTYPTVITDAASITNHSIVITGLTADTKYYYRVGSSSAMSAADAQIFFTTLPLSNTTRKIRIAAFGDCGRNDNSFQSNTLSRYTSYLSANGIDAPDAWLLLGDNAYNNGTDAEFTSNFFSAYSSSILKNHKLYPTPGNHDYAQSIARQNDHLVPYYDIFTVPAAGQLGGVSSGSEAWYSFDIGDIHFMALDSYGLENSGTTRIYDTTGAQALWVKADLAANTKKWTIAYWHHPPYTKGSHNSDSETELIRIRENFLRILERNGVDMIVCGHSHNYERSYLLNGYYKSNPAGSALSELDFNINTHTSSQSNGRYNGTANSCPYVYESGKYQHGTVYVVAGSSGADGGVQSGYPHNAFPFSQDDGGMLYFEVDNNRLDAKFIRRDGVIADQFTIMKDVNETTTVNAFTGSPVTLTASWPGNHQWTTTETTRSITITPSATGTTNYSVTDGVGCNTDQFTVVADFPLPVTLINFEVKENENGNFISWQTANETNNKHFMISRSADGIDFKLLTTVPASGNPNQRNKYSYLDTDPLHPVSYYKLEQQDIDGNKKQLGIRKISRQQENDLILNVQPSNQSLVIKIRSQSRSNISLRIYDTQGKQYKHEMLYNLQGTTTRNVLLNPGVYICEIKNEKGKKVVSKVVMPKRY